ncbi:hypothetical protein [Leucobacter chromiireducens]|uniref:hypothetical protein n=1 Tax=Leucobacter chromiireducens TaxID=283877 RepID=UPI000F641AA9|nr:hypothetical protein [Leucobacter chromiireducens]
MPRPPFPQRRVAAAFAGAAGIAVAIGAATILPANLTEAGRTAIEWAPTRDALIAGWAAEPSFDPIDPATLTLLERTPGDGFFFAVTTQAGRTVIGIATADGDGVQCSAPEHTPSAHGAGCASWSGASGPHLYAWAAADASTSIGYRHELLAFASEDELDVYLNTHPGLPDPLITPLPSHEGRGGTAHAPTLGA